MRGYVANTDFEWYSFLRGLGRIEEVNFWRPMGGRSFKVIEPGEPMFFRLKQPHARIVGYGLLERYEVLPVQLAWDARATGRRRMGRCWSGCGTTHGG